MRKRKTNEIKRLAKRALQGNFGTAILGVLIAFGTNIGASMLAGALFDSSTTWGLILCQVFLFGISLVTGILTAGLYYMYLNMARDRAFGLGDLVYFFKNCPDRVIVAGFVLALIDLVASIPYYCYSYLVVPGSSTQEWMDWAVRLTELMLLGLVLNLLLSLPFVMTYFCLADNPEISGIEALRLSARMMKGNKWRYLCLLLSFLPMLLLSVFTFYILLLWMVPYMEMAVTVLYQELHGELDGLDGNQTDTQRLFAQQDDYNSEA